MDTTFANIKRDEIRFDCRHYTGYKPCGKAEGCPGCTHYEPRGEQILIIKLGAMGDVLRTKAILPAIKRAYPKSWVVWLTSQGSEFLVRDARVDEIRTLTPEGLLALEGRRFAALYCLDKDPHALALSRRTPSVRKFGFAPTDYNTVSVWNEASMYALRLGLSDPLKYRQNTMSMPEIVAEMCELDYRGERYMLDISAPAWHEAEARWERVFGGMDPRHSGVRVIGLNTGCGPVFATKGWTRERMAEFVRRAAMDDNQVVMLLGGPRERELHEWLMRESGALADTRIFDSGTHNPLEVFAGLVDRCDVVLSSDSLAMHIAIALGRPIITWFGPTCHQEVDLFGLGEKIVTDFPCSPCYLKSCPKPVFCLEAMTAEHVYTAVQNVLARVHEPR